MLAINMRSLPKFAPDLMTDRACPLILIEQAQVAYATCPADKERLIQRFKPATDVLLMAWPGPWETDIVLVTEQDLINRRLREPK
jgi:hypothetical protein